MTRRVKVLVVDDDATTRLVLQGILRNELDCIVGLAESGEHAMRSLAIDDYDLVLLDVIMPGMNGVQTLRRIRADKRREHLPVIAVATAAEVEFVTEMYQLGVRGYILKPLQLDALNKRLEPILTDIRGEGDPQADSEEAR